MEAAPARRAFNQRDRWALLAAFALIVIFRLPHAWVEGRFQDEEATVFLAYAWHHPWLDALFRPFGGYWNLGATATTVLVVELVRSGLLPLERAPYVTMIIALAIQLLPAVLILTGRGQWLTERLAVITALLIIAITPGTEEVFFNVLHIQFHLALCAALILALDVPRRRAMRIAYGTILILAPLCGPGAIVFLPLFALRWLIERDFGRMMQLGCLAVGAAVQLLLFYGASPVRGHLVDPGTVAAAMFVRLIALPAGGLEAADRAGAAIYGSLHSGTNGWWWAAAASFLLFGMLILVAAKRRDAAFWLILSGLSVAAASLSFGMVIVNRVSLFIVVEGERYNFLPLVLLGLGLVALAMRPGFRGRGVCALLCTLMLAVGAFCYPWPFPAMARGPSWTAEVRAWRRDHDHPLAVWPIPWKADLSDRTRTCSAPGSERGKSSDPRYCESGWVAGFYSRSDR